MVKREFSGSRFYKLASKIVVIFTIFFLGFGLYGLANLDKNSLFYLDGFSKCTKEVPHDVSPMLVCGSYIDAKIDSETMTWNFLKIGILLPILFFGGTWLFKYLFPEKKER